MKRNLILGMLLLFSISLYSQKYTLSGYIKDASSGEMLIGANVFDEESYSGTSTNSYGFFSLTLPSGEYEIEFSYIGYQSIKRSIKLDKDIEMEIQLASILGLEEVEIVASNNKQTIQSTQMSSIEMSVDLIKKAPALLGEVDVMKAIQLLPGVQSGSEASAGLYVRGGGPDQNLILLDGTPVYNASHLFGIVSVFNADAIKNINIVKGGFPARYGGRLSSVLNINLKEGNMKEFHGAGTVGLLSTKLTLEGPIIKDQTSFLVTGRTSYWDKVLQPIIRLSDGSSQDETKGYYFKDFNAKINHIFSNKDRVFLSFYIGQDKIYNEMEPYTFLHNGKYLTESYKDNQQWGNIIAAARWNHQFSNKLFSNTSLTYSNYQMDIISSTESTEESIDSIFPTGNSLELTSGIEDYAFKIDFDYIPSSDHYVRFGANYIYHTFKPGAAVSHIVNREIDTTTTTGDDPIYASEYSLYIEDDFKINSRLKANYGLHYSGFYVNERFYHSIQPRISARYLFSESFSAKASYARMQQYIHLLTTNNIGIPADLWVPATDRILPQKADQFAAGVSKSFGEMYLLSFEAYYKKMNNIIEYKDGASFMQRNDGWEEKVASGQGWSYGGELFVEKKIGKLTGWVGYTLSWTDRQFDDPNINGGEKFPYKYDRRHDISVVASFPLDEGWNFSASWVYGTGNAITIQTERYFGDMDYYSYYYDPYVSTYSSDQFTGEVYYVDGRNTYRAAAYHRLDISFQKTKEKKWGEATWALGVYNAYNRKNPFYYTIGRDSHGNRALIRVSLLPLIPSVSYSFNF